jgi:hypothetical protein
MRLRVRRHRVPGGAALRYVIVPAAPLRGTHITKLVGHHTGALIGSRADLLRLGALFRLAAVSPHSALFLPLRAPEATGTAGYWAETQGLADLLVLRRDVGLRPSAWPGIRAGLRRGPHPGSPATVVAPAPRPRSGGQSWEWRLRHLEVAEYAETVLLTGGSRDLFEAGDELTRCGDRVAVDSEIRRHGGPAMLGQFAGSERSAGRRGTGWECMILAEDEIFHRARWAAGRPATRR